MLPASLLIKHDDPPHHVAGGASSAGVHSGGCPIPCHAHCADAKVGNEHGAIRRLQYVVQLQIAVHDASAVQVLLPTALARASGTAVQAGGLLTHCTP